MSTTTTLRYAEVELADTDSRKEGRLQSVADIVHALSDYQGNLEDSSIDIEIDDQYGRPIATALDDPTSQNFQRDEVVIFARSAEGRLTNATPRRLGRALLQNIQYGTPLVGKFTADDAFFCDGGAFNSDKKIPTWTVPPTYYFLAPKDVYQHPFPIIIGEVSDEGARDPATGLPASRGLCPLTFLGLDGLPTGRNGTPEPWGRFNVCLFAAYKILGVYGTDCGGGIFGRSLSSGATSNGVKPQSTITLAGSPNLSSVSINGDMAITLYTPTQGRQERQIIGKTSNSVTINNDIAFVDCADVDWYIATDLPQRKKINLSTRNGAAGDCMVFGYPGYLKPTTYEDILSDGENYRVQELWVRGPLLDAHLAGEITLAANVIGVEDVGDGTGKPITDYFTAYNWFLENCVLKNSNQPRVETGTGHWPLLANLITYADGTYVIRGSSFADTQAQTAALFGGRGFQVSAYFGDPMAVRDVIALWNLNANCRLGVNEHGQIFVYRFDPLVDTSAWPLIEHSTRLFGDVIRTNPQTETENVVQGTCDWDPDGQRYRNQLVSIVSPSGLAHNKNIRKLTTPPLEGKLTRDVAQWNYVLNERLAALRDGPVYVEFTGDKGLGDLPVGSGIRLTTIMGTGAVGYVARPLIILRKRTQVGKRLVTLTCLDPAGRTTSDGIGGAGAFVPPALEYIFEDEGGSPTMLGDEVAKTTRLLSPREPGGIGGPGNTFPLPPPDPPPPTTTPPGTAPVDPPPPPPPPGPVPSGAISITGGADIMATVNQYPAGTTFFLESGTYQEQTIHARSGDIFIGDSATILNGGHALTSPAGSNPWYYINQFAEGPYDTAGGAAYKADRQASGHPEDVFIDGVIQQHVDTLGEVTTGMWYFDYGANIIYIGTDPTGHTVSTSTTAKAIDAANVSNAHFSYLIIEQYAIPTQQACVSLGGGCVMQYCEVRTSHYGGIETGPGSQALSNIVHHNGVFGFIGSGNPLIDGNVIYTNNTAGGDEFWGAGGAKWVYADGLIVRNNHSYNNKGCGLWNDINNINVLYEQNILENNELAGTFHEISYDAIYRYSTYNNNGNNFFGSYPSESNIGVCDSRNVQVYGNVCTGPYWSIGFLQDDRGGPFDNQTSGLWEVDNYYAHDNTITITGDTAAGGYAPDNSWFTGRNNRFQNNTYNLNGVSPAFKWGGDLTLAGFNAAGQS